MFDAGTAEEDPGSAAARDPGDGRWRVMFDGSASTPIPLADRAAADRWVEAQPASDCAAP